MTNHWTHKVVKQQRGMQGEWFPYRAAGILVPESKKPSHP